MCIYIYIAVAVAIVILLGAVYNKIAMTNAAHVLLIFLVQSFLVKNIHYTKRPLYIQTQALLNIDIVPILYRPLAKLYIKRSGINMVSRTMEIVIKKTEEDHNLEIIK